MRMTNERNLPENLVRVVRDWSPREDNSRLHVTELIDPPRQVWLKRRHFHEIESDAAPWCDWWQEFLERRL